MMDYSLLIGVRYVKDKTHRKLPSVGPATTATATTTSVSSTAAATGTANGHVAIASSAHATSSDTPSTSTPPMHVTDAATTNGTAAVTQSGASIPNSSSMSSLALRRWRTSLDGHHEIYHIGIIDYLSRYFLRKKGIMRYYSVGPSFYAQCTVMLMHHHMLSVDMSDE
jgi:hypothetical protein